MVTQPLHLIAGTAYGLVALMAFGVGVSVLRHKLHAADSTRRYSGWGMFSLAVGCGFYAGDQWQLATKWPPVRGIHHGPLHTIGFFFMLLLFVLMSPALIAARAKDRSKYAVEKVDDTEERV